VEFNFEWDPKKAKSNKQKHRISFEQAATVFRDPRAASIYDEGHNGPEDRWITLGLSEGGGVLSGLSYVQTDRSYYSSDSYHLKP
jgi:uncharacterized DUF497 family protein